MAVTFGFYDSINHDRVYNARQFNQFLDGVINDGIYRTIGSCFFVSPVSGLTISVGPGKGFFNGVWTYNDSALELTLEAKSSSSNERMDSVILKIDENTRTNTIEIKKGTEQAYSSGNEPSPPEMIDADGVHEHRLANIYFVRNASAITAANIRNNIIGSSETPFTMFSDLPYATNYTYGLFNAGDAAASGYYEFNPGIVPRCIMLFSVKSKTRPSSAGGGSYYYPSIEPWYNSGSSSSGECSKAIFLMRGNPSPGSSGSDWAYWWDKTLGNSSVDPRNILRDELTARNGQITSCKIKFFKNYWPGFGYRAWLAIGEPLNPA